VSRARLAPILEAIRLYRALGVWTEVTTLVVPGVNDSDDELRQIAEFLCSVDPGLPWHVSQFQPAWKMLDRPITPLETLRRARKIGFEAGLRFVYEGNVSGEGGENTHCPACGTLLVRRYGLTLISNRIANGACPDCHEKIEGEGMASGEDIPGGRNVAANPGRAQHVRARLVATSRGFRERPAWNALRSALPDAWLEGSRFRGVLVVEAEGEPLVLAEHCLRTCGEAVGHVTPVLAEVPTELDAIREAAGRVAIAQVGARQSVCFRIRRRGWIPPGREPRELEREIGAAVLDALERSLGARPRVDLEHPDVTIVAEVLGPETAIGVVLRSWRSGGPAPEASGPKEG
jgi:tRNA(Ser,Leu) C12 N-acetylase TAN1